MTYKRTDSVKDVKRTFSMLVKQQIPSAAIVLIVASFAFGCETRNAEFQAGYNVQPVQKQDTRGKQNDATFLIEAAHELSLEAQLAELAVKKAASPRVKEFAVSVLTDHRFAMDEVRELAARIKADLPEQISATHREDYVHIARKSGLQFDRAFCTFLSQNNTVLLKKFEKIAQEGSNDVVRDWAFGKLGILRRQIAMAGKIEHAAPGDSTMAESSID